MPVSISGGPMATPVVGSMEADSIAGRMFWSGSGRLNLTAAGNLRAVFLNPAGSGKDCRIRRFDTGSSEGPAYCPMFLNPTVVPSTTAARPVHNVIAGSGVQAVGRVRADINLTTPLSGGTDMGLVFGVPNQQGVFALTPLIVPPGVSVGFNFTFVGVANAALILFWSEHPVGT